MVSRLPIEEALQLCCISWHDANIGSVLQRKANTPPWYTQVLEDEQINLSRAAERLLSLQEEAKMLAEKGPSVKEPAPEGEPVTLTLDTLFSTCSLHGMACLPDTYDGHGQFALRQKAQVQELCAVLHLLPIDAWSAVPSEASLHGHTGRRLHDATSLLLGSESRKGSETGMTLICL